MDRHGLYCVVHLPQRLGLMEFGLRICRSIPLNASKKAEPYWITLHFGDEKYKREVFVSDEDATKQLLIQVKQLLMKIPKSRHTQETLAKRDACRKSIEEEIKVCIEA